MQAETRVDGATIDAARAAAGAAARRAGVTTRPAARMDEFRDAAGLFEVVWGRGPEGPPMHSEVLRETAHAGGTVTLAFDGPTLVGAAVLGPALPPGSSYGYLAAAMPGRAGAGVGRALKLAQRAWALEAGLTSMRWTFDPLVARNARFNLGRLGATAPEYEVAFFGRMTDSVNGADESDRLVARWDLASPRVAALAETPSRAGESADAPAPRPPEPAPAAEPVPAADAENVAGAPDGAPLARRDATGLWCRVPTDVVELRRSDPTLASAWRLAVREVFVPEFAAGAAATFVTRDGWYLLQKGLS